MKISDLCFDAQLDENQLIRRLSQRMSQRTAAAVGAAVGTAGTVLYILDEIGLALGFVGLAALAGPLAAVARKIQSKSARREYEQTIEIIKRTIDERDKILTDMSLLVVGGGSKFDDYLKQNMPRMQKLEKEQIRAGKKLETIIKQASNKNSEYYGMFDALTPAERQNIVYLADFASEGTATKQRDFVRKV